MRNFKNLSSSPSQALSRQLSQRESQDPTGKPLPPPLGKTPSGRREMSRKRQREDCWRANARLRGFQLKKPLHRHMQRLNFVVFCSQCSICLQ